MLLVNHALTGALLGLVIEPAGLIVPAAFGSHFALDALPHFGHREPNIFHRTWIRTGVLDGAATVLALAVVCLTWPQRLPHVLLGVGFAILPDLVYVPEVLFRRRLSGWFGRLHARIQWAEIPTGWVIEAVWAFVVVTWMLGLAV